MNAIELAEVLITCRHPDYIGLLCREASEVVRRQHEAILKLREALAVIQSKAGGTSTLAYRVAEQALKDTEGL